MKNALLIVLLIFIISFTGNKRQPFLVNIEKIRVTQAADLSAIPGTTADMFLVVDRSTALASGTLPFPSDPIDGQIFMVSSRIDIGAVTLSTNGRAISGSIITLGAGDFVGWTYDLASDRWFPYGFSAQKDIDLFAYQALGSPIVTETVAQKLQISNTSTPMVDNQIKYTAVFLPKAASLTGVKVYVRVLGVYTGDNNNRIGLYSYSAGVLTLVASSTNSSTLWTSAANAIQTIPFTTPYTATSNIYFVAFLYNQSAQTTAPSLASGVVLNNLAMASTAMGFSNSAKLHGTSLGNDLPASINMSAITGSAIPSWVSLY